VKRTSGGVFDLPGIAGATGGAGDTGNTGVAIKQHDDDRPRLDRALRALRVSGRRLVQRKGRWEIRADGRSAPVAVIKDQAVALLLADGKLAPAEGGGYVLTAAAVEEVTAADAEAAPSAGPWIFTVAGRPRRGASRGFAGLAKRVLAHEGPLTLRQATAGLKLIADAEQSGRDFGLTMNWDARPVDRRRSSSSSNGKGPARLRAARQAERRIRRARARLGDQKFALLWSACIDQDSLSRLEQCHRLPRHGAAGALAEALELLAAVYDGNN
jgi:hypothetical protein